MKCKYCKCKVNKEDLVIKGINYFCSNNCYLDYIDNQKETTKPITQRKAINKISKKKKQRIKEGGSEVELFKEIWEEREHKCEICGKYLQEAKAHNFSHIKSKGSRPDLRLDKTNIQILCFRCHFKKDMGLDYKGPDLD